MPKSVSAQVTIGNKLGLHARPAMLFVERASGYESDVKVRRVDASESVDGKSIMQMMMLAATQGTTIEITATGKDSETVLNDLIALVESRFQED